MLVIALVAMVMGHQGGGPSARQDSEQSGVPWSAAIDSEPAFVWGTGRGAGVGVGRGAASVFSEETEAGVTSREVFFATAVGRCAATMAPPEMPPMSRTAAVVLSLRRNMVLKTPWVNDRTESDTLCAAENCSAEFIVYSTRGVGTGN